MSVTTTDVTNWKLELETLIDDVADDQARAALTSLHSALEPYFDNPEYFRTLLGKIQRTVLSAPQQAEITMRSFANLDELKAALPDGVTVTAIP